MKIKKQPFYSAVFSPVTSLSQIGIPTLVKTPLYNKPCKSFEGEALVLPEALLLALTPDGCL